MTNASRARKAGLLGALLAVVSLLAFPSLLTLVQRPELEVHTDAPDVVVGPAIEIPGAPSGSVRIDGTPARVDEEVDPGLHLIEWRRHYLGGHTRSVGHAQLVGPFQDPKKPACGLSLLIAPSFLDQTAPILQTLVSKQLHGMSQWPVGDFRGVTDTSLQWIRWEEKPPRSFRRAQLEAPLAGQRLHGHLRVFMNVEFENALVPLSLMVVPFIFNETLQFRIYVNAKLDLDNRLFQWVADFFDGNDRVSRLIDKEISREMRNVLDKPPDIPLEGGGSLALSFCNPGQLRFHEAGHVSMPLAIQLEDRSPSAPLHPGNRSAPSPPMSTPLALELDRNALGGVLHTLWASGLLDRNLAGSTVRAFNEHPTVRDFLNLRISQAEFHVPPTIDLLTQERPGLRLRSATRLLFEDGAKRTEARLFAEFDIDAQALREPEPGHGTMAAAVNVNTVQLTCRDESGVLRPCYSQIVAQLRANRDQLQGQLSELLRDLLVRLFTQRSISDPATPASYRLESTEFQVGAHRLRANLSGSVYQESPGSEP